MSSRKQKTRPASIGIDLGTMYSSVSTWNRAANKVDIIQRIPSSISFFHSTTFIGVPHKDLTKMNPSNTLFDLKRLIGRNFDDKHMHKDKKRWPFKLQKNTHSGLSIEITNTNQTTVFFVEEILAMFLFHLKLIAERHIGESVSNTVISVPHSFTNAQRQSVKDAARIAGLNVYRILNESTAIAVSYGLTNKTIIPKDCIRTIIVCNFGAGFSTAALLKVNGCFDEDDDDDWIGAYEIKSVSGDSHLGGNNFDDVLVDYFVEIFNDKYKQDCTKCSKTMLRLRIECEKIKCLLSEATEVQISIDSFYNDIDFISSINRMKFEELCVDYFDRYMNIISE
eukprot:174229_1